MRFTASSLFLAYQEDVADAQKFMADIDKKIKNLEREKDRFKQERMKQIDRAIKELEDEKRELERS